MKTCRKDGLQFRLKRDVKAAMHANAPSGTRSVRCLTSTPLASGARDRQSPVTLVIGVFSDSALRSKRAHLIPVQEDLLGDVELEHFGIHAVDHGRNDLVDGRRYFAYKLGISRGEVQVVGEICNSILERCFDEKRVDLLREDRTLQRRLLIIGMGGS